MDAISELVNELSKCIRDSGIPSNYKAAIEQVKSNNTLLEAIKEFKRVQRDYSMQQSISFDQEKHLSKLYFDLCMDPDAKNFLECEKRFLSLMVQVKQSLWSEYDDFIYLFD